MQQYRTIPRTIEAIHATERKVYHIGGQQIDMDLHVEEGEEVDKYLTLDGDAIIIHTGWMFRNKWEPVT